MNKIKPYLTVILYLLSAIIAISFLIYQINQSTTKEKEYTVYSENKVFENLKRLYIGSNFNIYQTISGKTIEFHGTFTEIEEAD